MAIQVGDVLRARRTKQFHHPYERGEYWAYIARKNRLFQNNVLSRSPTYIYSLLYVVVGIDNDWVVWVKRVDRHARYMVSPYTFVGKRYLERWGTKVGERRDIAEDTRRRRSKSCHGYAGLIR
jgi:hypothetical protein